MGLKKFEIVLDNPNGAYYSDTEIKGRLEFTLDAPKKIRAVKIKLIGVANTSWIGRKGGYSIGGLHDHHRASRGYFSGTEEYFSSSYNLAGGPNRSILLSPGNHVYPFSTQLPPMLPSSFESKYGKIKYEITGVLDRPWKFDHTVEKVIIVIAPVDLNLHAKAKKPLQQEEEKTLCCWCCVSGQLTVIIDLPYCGFVPGQIIPVKLDINNASNSRVEEVELKLEKVLKWKATFPTFNEREESFTEAKQTFDVDLGPNNSRCDTYQLAIPIMSPCNVEPSTIISCTYSLQVTTRVSGCHLGLHGEVPIFLGTVPVHTSKTNVMSPKNASSHYLPWQPPTNYPQSPVSLFVNPGPTDENMYPIIPTELLPQYAKL